MRPTRPGNPWAFPFAEWKDPADKLDKPTRERPRPYDLKTEGQGRRTKEEREAMAKARSLKIYDALKWAHHFTGEAINTREEAEKAKLTEKARRKLAEALEDLGQLPPWSEITKETRRGLGLTQKELAYRLGLKRQATISKWETGRAEPKGKRKKRLLAEWRKI